MKNPNIVTAFLEEPHTYFFLGVLLAFFWQTVGQGLAGLYFILLAADAFSLLTFQPKLNFNSISGNTPQALGTALVALIVFLGLAWLLVSTLQAASNLDIGQIFLRIRSAIFGAAAPPLLENNRYAIFIIGTFLIPTIETKSLISRLMEILAKIFKIPLELRSLQTWILFLIVSAIGVIFHFQAKGVGATEKDTIALMLTFLFWMVSCFLIVKTRESESAVYLHMMNNGLTLAPILKAAPVLPQ